MCSSPALRTYLYVRSMDFWTSLNLLIAVDYKKIYVTFYAALFFGLSRKRFFPKRIMRSLLHFPIFFSKILDAFNFAAFEVLQNSELFFIQLQCLFHLRYSLVAFLLGMMVFKTRLPCSFT